MLTRRDLVTSSSLAAFRVPGDVHPRGPDIIAIQSTTLQPGILPTPQAYGAKGDGVTDDTNAFNNALANNPVVYVPARRYVVGNVVIRSGNSLIGFVAGPLYDSVRSTTAPTLMARSGATCVLDVHNASGFQIAGLAIDGINNNPNGISDGSNFGTLQSLTVSRCNNGLGG